MDIRKLVYNYKTKYKQGFTRSEIKKLLKKFPKISQKKFNIALGINTCMIIDDEIITYHCDIEKALYCIIENRSLRVGEWD